MRRTRIGIVVRGFVGVATLAMAVAGANAQPQHTDAVNAISKAKAMLADGQFVAAKHTLRALRPSDVPEAQRDDVSRMFNDIERAWRTADPNDISLQKATLALADGDLRTADRHASAVMQSRSASREHKAKASSLLDQVAKARAAFEPLVADALDRAHEAAGKGDFARAKSEAEAVMRSGVRLSEAQQRTLDSVREQVLRSQRRNGEALAPEAPTAAAFAASGQPDKPETTQEKEKNQNAEELFRVAKQFDAQRLLREADAAFDAGRLNEALTKYTSLGNEYRDALSEDEQKHVDQRVGETQTLLNQPNLLDQTLKQQQLVREEALAQFNNFLSEATQSLAQGDTDRATQLASEARVRLTQAREVFSDDEFNSLMKRQQQALKRINDSLEKIQQREAEDRAKQLQRQQKDRERAELQERDRKIAENLDRIRELQSEQKYKEALQVVDQVLFLDPQNPAGLLLKDVLQDVSIYREWERTQRDKQLSYAKESVNIQKSMVAPEALLDYPADWPEISVRRGEPQSFVESPGDRRVLAELDSRRIPASFAANSLQDVLQFVATVTNLNVDVDWDSLANIGVDRDTPVTLNLQPVPARVVLERVLDKASPDAFSKAGWAVNDGVLVIASEEALRKNTFIVIYDVRDLTFGIRDATEGPQIDLNNVLNQASSSGGGGGGSGSIFSGNEEVDTAGLTQEELLDLIEDIIKQSVDFEGWRDNGGDTGSVQRFNGNLIITNTARNHRQISGLLRQLREIRSIQINVQANFLAVDQNFFEQIGFDVDVLFNAQNSQFQDALAQQANQRIVGIPSGRTNLRPTDLIAPFFSGDGSSSVQEFAFDPNQAITNNNQNITIGNFSLPFTTTRPDPVSIIPAQQNSLDLSKSLFSGSTFASTILSANPALGIAGSFLDDVQVDFLIEATQADKRSVQLTAPRLTLTNGHRSNIFFTTQTAFVSNLQPVVGTSSVAFNPTLSSLNTGVTLDIEGVVSADRRYVTLNIQTGIAELQGITQRAFTATAGGVGGGGAGTGTVGTATASIDFPTVSVTSITTGVSVPDQGTLLLGGQRLKTENNVETGVPVLSKIPVLNRFFTNRIEETTERTLMILIKPTILIQSEEEEKNFPGLLDTLRNRFGSGF